MIVGLLLQLIELHRDALVNRGMSGPSRSRPPSDLIKAMRDLVENLERWDDDAEKAELARGKARTPPTPTGGSRPRVIREMNRPNPGLAAVGVAEEGHEGQQGHEGHPTEAREGQQGNASVNTRRWGRLSTPGPRRRRSWGCGVARGG